MAEWTETVQSFSYPAYLRKLDLSVDKEVLVELIVVDNATGGPAGVPPYTLIVEVWPLSAAGTLRESKLPAPRLEQTIRKPDCQVQQSMDVLPEFVERVDTIERGDTTRTVKAVRTVTAGRQLGIRVPAGWASAQQPAMLNLYAKSVGDGPFMRVCKDVALKSVDSVVNVVGVAPVADESVWRVEIVAARQSSAAPRPPNVEVSRTKVLASAPTISHSDAWRHGLAHMCFERTLDRVVGVPASTAFGGRSQLTVDLSEFSAALSRQQRDELHAAILQAVYLWVRSCVVCRLDNLVLVNIDGRTFVHPGLYGTFGVGWNEGAASRPRPEASIPALSARGASDVDNMLRTGLGSARAGVPMQSQPYREVTQHLTSEFKEVCTTKADPKRHTTLVAIQRAVCSGAGDASSTARIKVAFNDGSTFCGNNANIIACRADDELTELNVRDYRFRMSGPTLKSIGAGTIEVDFLHTILHEMGHWIGLKHLDVGESLMASTMEQSRCINARTIEGLARRVFSDERMSREPAAFRYLKAQ